MDNDTAHIYFGYAKQWAVEMPSLLDISTASAKAYASRRLTEVLRRTVRKELSALRMFIRWCVEHRHIRDEVFVPVPSREKRGVRVSHDRKKGGKLLTREEVELLLKALPVLSSRKSRGTETKFLVRDYFIALYETGLRPATIQKLSHPRHFKNLGAPSLWIEEAIDKCDDERIVPLSERARNALSRAVIWAGEGRLLFGKHDCRKLLEKACKVCHLEGVTEYDFKHSRITHLQDAGAPITGIMSLVGHTQASTTDKYTKRSTKAAQAALEAGEKT